MVRDSLQKAVLVDFLLAKNQFRTNYKATFLWDSNDLAPITLPFQKEIKKHGMKSII